MRTVVFRLYTENYRFSTKLLYAVAYVAGGLSGLPSSSEGAAVSSKPPYRFGHAGRVTLPLFRGSGRSSVICKVQAPSRDALFTFYTLHFTLSRPGGGYSVPLFAAQSRHGKPYPPISKIKFRLAFEMQGESIMPHSPTQRKRDFGELKFCAWARRD